MIQLAECLLTTTALRGTGERIHPVTQDTVSWPPWQQSRALCTSVCILFWLVFVNLTQTTHLRRESLSGENAPIRLSCRQVCGYFLDW